MVETARVQYVFLDVVGYTRNRSVEAQSEVVATLNDIVLKSLQELEIPIDRTVLIPTGDGIAIALIDVSGFDIHLQLALRLLGKIANHNSATADKMRQFSVRIGINENIDNVLLDINGRKNVAGAGISMAQRIMDKADASQILVGHTVYDVLRQREKYFSSFRAFSAIGKHGINFNVYQFSSKDSPGLNMDVPTAFAVKKSEPAKLTKFVAYYIAHAQTNRDFLQSKKNDAARNYAATVLLSFIAADAEEISDTPVHEDASVNTWGAGEETFEKQYLHYASLEFWVICRLSDLLASRHLNTYSEYFEGADFMTNFAFVKQSGIKKLIDEWPEIATEFRLKPTLK